MGARLAAVVLAAGASRRMAGLGDKRRLDLRGRTVLERAILCFLESGVVAAQDIQVVTGPGAEALAPVIASLGAARVVNPQPEAGMFSSVLAGLAALGPGVEGVFVLPADIPLVLPATIRRLAAAFVPGQGLAAVPTFAGRRGHPPLLDAGLVSAIREYAGPQGLRGALWAASATRMAIETDDPGVLLDIDTPEDYARALSVASQGKGA